VREEPAAGPAEGPAEGPAAKPAGPESAAASPVLAAARQRAAEPPPGQAPPPGPVPSPEEAAASPSPWSDPRFPWEGKPRRVDIACWAAITLSGLYYLALLPFRASLVGTHPIVMVLLNGSIEAIVSAAAFARVGHGSLAVVLLASIPGLMKFDLIYWWAGRLWGEKILQLFTGQRGRARKRAERFIERVHRWGRWFTWPAVILTPFLPIPNALVYAVAGWTGMSWVTFLVLDAIGTLGWAGMLAGLGYALGQHAVSVAQAISRYGLWVAIAVVVLVVASQLRNARTQA